METKNNQFSKETKNVGWLPLVIMAFLVAIVVGIIYLFKNEKRFSVVTLYGKGSAINFSKPYNFVFFSSGQKNKGALLAEQGDLFGFNNTFTRFSNIKRDSMEINDEGDSLIFMNGKINSIIINEKTALLPWFHTMTATDIAELETIYFSSPIPDSYIPYLKNIARLHPNTSLVFEDKDSIDLLNDYIKKVDFFTPDFVSVSITQDQLPLLARWKTTRCIYINLQDSVISNSLPAIPALNQCILYNDNPVDFTPAFFRNNKQIKKLTFLCGTPTDTLLLPMKNLQELIFSDKNKVSDLTKIKNKLSELSVLLISGNSAHIELISSSKKLRWLGLPENTTQQEFNTIISGLDGLQVLELTGTDSITNLSSLNKLSNLRGLVITDTVTDKKTLYTLTNLRYLSLPQNNKSDSSYLQALEKALPGCIIVPNSGACLGSGWLLLILPIVFIFSFLLFKRKLKKKEYEAS